ncbi:MAG: hypothetical protein WBA05_15345 [Gordonia sp. (in: high G+C Gram-positive bacteria)]|uniref:hypothetical protein n=1 Tax=Gordonia sp. (in: high G+C Gram-positive bacteria) TaxID=84139 RepID=UPI003C781E29
MVENEQPVFLGEALDEVPVVSVPFFFNEATVYLSPGDDGPTATGVWDGESEEFACCRTIGRLASRWRDRHQ